MYIDTTREREREREKEEGKEGKGGREKEGGGALEDSPIERGESDENRRLTAPLSPIGRRAIRPALSRDFRFS